MPDAEETSDPEQKSGNSWLGGRLGKVTLTGLAVLMLAAGYGWQSREEIADDLIASQLEALGIDARYEIEEIGLTRQVLSNFSVGDPAQPDLTIERVELVPDIGFFSAGIGSLKLVRPRLRASYLDGQFSLGALDPALETDSSGSAGLPSWSLELVDGSAQLTTDYGALELTAEGAGQLDGGFQGTTHIVAPNLQIAGCTTETAQISGDLRTSLAQPFFDGTIELANLNCADQDIELPHLAIKSSVEAQADFSGFSGALELTKLSTELAGIDTEELGGNAEFSWVGGILNAQYEFSSAELSNDYLSAANSQLTGGLRFRAEDARWEIDAKVKGADLALNSSAEEALASASSASEGTLIAPIIGQIGNGLKSGLEASEFEADVLARQSTDGFSLMVPSGRLNSPSGGLLLAISQGQWVESNDGELTLAGNIASEGQGLPQIHARMESAGSGVPKLHMRMAEYEAEGSSLAIPDLVLTQVSNTSWALDGNAQASGAIPGGEVSDLSVSIVGRLRSGNSLTLGQGCTEVGFARLQMAELDLDQERITICPDEDRPILAVGPDGLKISARMEGLELEGSLGDSPIRLATGRIGFDQTDGLSAEQVTVELGEQESLSTLTLSRLLGNATEGLGGSFAGLSGGLDAVPLDIERADGSWSFADGILTLNNVQFDVLDRADEERFERLYARDAALSLKDNRITASATMRHPDTDRRIVNVDLEHNLGTGIGFADLDVPGIVFDDQMEPGARIDQCYPNSAPSAGPTGLTCLATGIVALAEGTVTGAGRIDWNPDEVTSSGSFSTDGFDFAAAFGPVQAVSGTIQFSDLLSLTTDGTQSLNIGAIDPGVVVFDGILDFALIDGTLVSLRGGRWPFFGGTMELLPTELNFAVAEERSYIIEMTGVDAAQFIAAMDFSNISASGTFDGYVPLVFDELGNGRITNGLLISRAPGGNVSYVGDLSYEDTGAIANYAFQSLRSLDFNQMMVEMDGPLTGEIITRLLFDGVSQGEDADRNFITEQIAKLPIRFNVNVRASFYELMNDLLRTYDPATNLDPRALDLIRGINGQTTRPANLDGVRPTGESGVQDEPSIQTEESETLP